MENQQLDPDDLTGESPDEVCAADAASGRAETDCARGRLGYWLVAVVGAAAVLLVGCAAFAGVAVQRHLADRSVAATRVEVERTAAAAITALWTYTPDTIDTLADRAADYLTGDFEARYRRFLEAAVAPNKQAQVSDTTDVVGVAVESLNGPQGVAIVFTNTTATSPLTKNIPSLKYVSYRLDMSKHDSRWLVTNISTISFVDLTPKL